MKKNKAVELTEMEMEKKPENKKDLTSKTSKGSGLRFNKGKLRYDLVHPKAHEDMVKVLTMGAEKYFDRNWERGLSWESVIASLKRHIAAIESGEDYDRESGLLHIAHAACNVHFLNAFYYDFPQGDDRPKRFFKQYKVGLDIDEVLADWVTAWIKKYGIEKQPESWYFDRKIMDRFEEMRTNGELDDFYMGLEPLVNPSELPFQPHCYITSRPVSTKITEAWLDKHGFPTAPVHTVELRKSKVDVAKEAGINIFIDDSFSNFIDLNKEGILTYLFSRKHNQKFDVGHLRINSLKDIPLFR